MITLHFGKLWNKIRTCTYDDPVLVHNKSYAVFFIMNFFDQFRECLCSKTAVNNIVFTVCRKVFSHHYCDGIICHANDRARHIGTAS